MAAPTATQIRAFLEGYGITTDVLTDSWINDCRDNEVIPHVQEVTRQVFTSATTEITEYYSGNGKDILILNRRPVNSITSIILVGGLTELNVSGSFELISAEGMVKAKNNYYEGIYGPYFQKGTKNYKVTYQYGYADYPADVARAIMQLVSAKALNLIGARTGGGALSVQAFSRNYGSHGKYTDIRKELVSSAYYTLVRKYGTGVVGA